MKKIVLTSLLLLCGFVFVNSQIAPNPFVKYGFKNIRAYSFSKGEFEEFHDNKNVVEIGSILYDTKTNQVIGYIEEVDTDVDVAVTAMSIDPMAEKYPWISPYAYCLNNPVRYVDPDGREVVIKGDDDFRKRAFDDMQKLTSSSLVMLKSGKVMEVSNYNEKKHGSALFSGEGSGNKEFGTAMVSELIGSKHTVSINIGETHGFSDYKVPDAFMQGGKAGDGSGSTVKYDPKDIGTSIRNADGSYARFPAPYIGLAHELIHGWRAATGKMGNVSNTGFASDPDRPSGTVSAEEYVVRQYENFIRNEHKFKLRTIPIPIKR